MKWEGNRESDNVEDRRGDGGGGGGGFPIGGRGIGIGTVVLALIGWGVFGINPLTTIGVLSGGGSPQVQQQAPAHRPAGNDQEAKFVSTVLASTEDVWTQVFQANGAQYQKPKLVLYTGVTRTASGTSGWTTSGRVDFPPQADNNKHSRQAPNKEKRRDTADYPHATG